MSLHARSRLASRLGDSKRLQRCVAAAGASRQNEHCGVGRVHGLFSVRRHEDLHRFVVIADGALVERTLNARRDLGCGNCAISDISATVAAKMRSDIRMCLARSGRRLQNVNGDTGRVILLPTMYLGHSRSKLWPFVYLDAPFGPVGTVEVRAFAVEWST